MTGRRTIGRSGTRRDLGGGRQVFVGWPVEVDLALRDLDEICGATRCEIAGEVTPSVR